LSFIFCDVFVFPYLPVTSVKVLSWKKNGVVNIRRNHMSFAHTIELVQPMYKKNSYPSTEKEYFAFAWSENGFILQI
jgi:hypothetical protein